MPESSSSQSERYFIDWPWKQLTVLFLWLGILSNMINRITRPWTTEYQDFLTNCTTSSFGLVGFCIVSGVLSFAVRKWWFSEPKPGSPTLPWLEKYNAFLAFCVFIAFFVSLFSLVVTPFVRHRGTPEQVASRPWRTFYSADQELSVNAPWDWQQKPSDDYGVSSISVVHPKMGLHFVAYITSKSDTNDTSLREWAERSTNRYKATISEPTQMPLKAVDHDGRQYQVTSFEGTQANARIRCYIFSWEDPESWGEIRFWSSPSQMDAHLQRLEVMTSTLRRHQK